MKRWQLQMSLWDSIAMGERRLIWESCGRMYPPVQKRVVAALRRLMELEIDHARNAAMLHNHGRAEYRLYDRVENVYHYWTPAEGYWFDPEAT